MARNTNTVILVGHLGSGPEIRQFQNGGQIATFNLKRLLMMIMYCVFLVRF